MKKAEYAAGVTSIYRKYLDKALQAPDGPYQVSEEDLRHLFRLFNREGFTKGFLQHTAPEKRVAVHEKSFRAEEEDFLRFVRGNYIEKAVAVPVEGRYVFQGDQKISLTLQTQLDGRVFRGEALSLNMPAPARKSPITREQLADRFSKLGDTGFVMASLEGSFTDGLFLPVSALNEIRRQAVLALREDIISAYRRTCHAPEEA